MSKTVGNIDVQCWPTGTAIGKNNTFGSRTSVNVNEKLNDDQLALIKTNKDIEKICMDESKWRLINQIYYIAWMDRKKKELAEKKQSKLEEDIRKQEAEISAKKSQIVRNMKFNEWLVMKQNEQNKKREEMTKMKIDIEFKNKVKKLGRQGNDSWASWMERKIKKEKELQKKRFKAERLQQEEIEQKKMLANKCFKDWLKKASKRPKPVRSNLGFASLSCTNIGFVNPVPWKNILDEKAKDSSKTLRLLFKKPSAIDVNLGSSTSTIQFYDQNSRNSLLRTAKWVESTSRQLTNSGKTNNEKEMGAVGRNVVKSERRQSAPMLHTCSDGSTLKCAKRTRSVRL